MVIFLRPDQCPKCKSQTIECYDYYGNPIGYHGIADKWMRGDKIKIDHKYPIYDMKCKRCGQHYNIKWINNCPLPDLGSGRGSRKEFIDFYINEVS